MSLPVDLLIRSAVVPACVSVAILLLWDRFGREEGRRRLAAAWAVAGGFLVGYLILPAPPSPTSHWHWLPYLGVLAAVAVPVGRAEGVHPLERAALYVIVAVAAAWFLVPDWPEMKPQRKLYMAAVGGAALLLSISLDRLAARMPGPAFPVVWCVTASAGAVVLAQSGNMKFAQLASVVGAVTLGVGLASTTLRRPQPLFHGAAAVVTILLGGLMFVGYVHSFSDVPAASYALIAAAPLAVSAGLFGQAMGVQRRGRMLLLWGAVLAPLGLATALALVAEPLW